MTSEVRTGKRTSTLLGVLAVVLLFGLPLFFGLASEDLRNDEAIYSYAVDRIVESGNWLTPESIPQSAVPGDLHDRAGAFLEKPPLKFWIVALPIKLGLLPHDEVGLRFWDALFGAIAFVYVFLIGRRLVDPVCGFAAVFLLFIQSWLLFGHGCAATSWKRPCSLHTQAESTISLLGAKAMCARAAGCTSSRSPVGSVSAS